MTDTPSLSVSTYNILADCYIKPQWYASSPKLALHPLRRLHTLVDKILREERDVYCLQEVEPRVFTQLLNYLSQYDGYFTQKGQGRPDGCATLYKNGVTLASTKEIQYDDEKIPSGHIAQISTFHTDQGQYNIANTHIRWDKPGTPREKRWAVAQVEELLSLVNPQEAWILCGDFNVTPDDEVVSMIEDAGLTFPFKALPHVHTALVNGKAKKMDYLFHTKVLESSPFLMPSASIMPYLPSLSEPSDHLATSARFSLSKSS